VRNEYATELVVRSVTVTSALGATSAYTWLKLPIIAEMERVLAATTLPVVVLGGDAGGEGSHEAMASFERVLSLPGVRGVAAGRRLLYPDDDDVAGAVHQVVRLLGRADEVPASSSRS
jgi:DhnA family fructose-bisphosphate aldolase class Ia